MTSVSLLLCRSAQPKKTKKRGGAAAAAAAAAPNIFDAMLVASVKQKAGPAEAAREQSAKPIRGEELEAWIVDDPKTVRRRPSRPARPVVQLSNHAVLCAWQTRHWNDSSLRKRRRVDEDLTQDDAEDLAYDDDEEDASQSSEEPAAAAAAALGPPGGPSDASGPAPTGVGAVTLSLGALVRPSPRTAAAQADAVLSSPRVAPSSPLTLPSPATMAPLKAAMVSMGGSGDGGLGGVDLTDVTVVLNWPPPPSPGGSNDADMGYAMPDGPASIMGWLEALPEGVSAGA